MVSKAPPVAFGDSPLLVEGAFGRADRVVRPYDRCGGKKEARRGKTAGKVGV